MPAITSLINEIFADTAFIPRRECMGSYNSLLQQTQAGSGAVLQSDRCNQ